MSDSSSRTYQQQYYQQHKEQRKEQSLLYYYAHYPTVKERNNATAKAYYWANREKILTIVGRSGVRTTRMCISYTRFTYVTQAVHQQPKAAVCQFSRE